MTTFTNEQILIVSRACDKGRHGAFMQHIGRAMRIADNKNLDLLMAAFKDKIQSIYDFESSLTEEA
jgi:hypothetical protein